MPMRKISTLNYLINSYQTGKKNVDWTYLSAFDNEKNQALNVTEEYEPSKNCIDSILSYAAQYDVLNSQSTGSIELNLN